ncbi:MULTISPECIES: hypothetical protein [unclassified Acidovorax]|uniref:hypothetical protein n=1 Tax=unclassified Acidovorax TaxID=2684926 RepID=UPI001C4773CB|nr:MULTISPECIES: hypothetical protein [unclassified Acidovorax]MBV7428217.1 hypothetical protein [Acidovorax sp. sif0732]MBV7449474.1 hypothetical protein [Acidovorax sp. sif0715]
MKKPLLATIGLAGACAACCAVPVLIPVISGLSVAGLAGLDWDRLSVSREYLASALGVAVALAVALGIWLARRRRVGKACTLDGRMPNDDGAAALRGCGCRGQT